MGAWTRHCEVCGYTTSPREVIFNESAVVLCPICRWAADRLLDDPAADPTDAAIRDAARLAWTTAQEATGLRPTLRDGAGLRRPREASVDELRDAERAIERSWRLLGLADERLSRSRAFLRRFGPAAA